MQGCFLKYQTKKNWSCMGKILVVAEKPSVGMDIAKVLNCKNKNKGYMEGDKYIVTWAVGHLIGLKYPEEHDSSYKEWKLDTLPFNFDIKNSLKVLPSTKEQFAVVKKLINDPNIDLLVNAGDAGREGYLIQEWIYRMAGNKKPKKVLWISSFSESAILNAFNNLKDPKDFENLLQEAEARAEGDYLLGINYSRVLTLTYGKGRTLLKYGRCQTIMLNQIVLRDLEIEAFVPKPYFTVSASYEKGFTGNLISEDKQVITFDNKAEAEDILTRLSDSPLKVISYKTQDKKTNPPLLYNLAALQKAMASKYGYSPEKTLKLAQSLYETHKILSYPRTDSRVISSDVYKEIKDHLNALYDIKDFRSFILKIKDSYSLDLNKRYVNDLKVTDHYALIPTTTKKMGTIYEKLSVDEKNVFDAVARSFLAMFYPDYKYLQTEVITAFDDLLFLSKGNTMTDPGFKEVFSIDETEKDTKEEPEEKIPLVNESDVLNVSEYKILDKKTKPPARFTDNSIIAFMEKNNIGTSATRAEILKKLQDSKAKYVDRDKGKYISTTLGRNYISMLPDEIKDLSVTQEFEEALSMINAGDITKADFLEALKTQQESFIDFFKEQSINISPDVLEEPRNASDEPEKGTMICPVCGSRVKDTGKGYFCSNRDCNFVLWNNMKFYQNEIKISASKARQLLSGRKRSLFKLKTKEGKDYEAYLKIVMNGKYTNFEIDGFPKKKKEAS